MEEEEEEGEEFIFIYARFEVLADVWEVTLYRWCIVLDIQVQAALK
jgi:hypothetical protein